MNASDNERLTKALGFANYKTAMSNRKMHLKMQMEDSLNYAVNGGIFAINRELISFVYSLVASGTNEAVLIDNRGNPVMVSDLNEFLELLKTRYFEATNDYFRMITLLNKARTVEQIAAI